MRNSKVVMNPESRVWVAGHRGLVGSAIVRRLQADGYSRMLLRGSAELDLRDRDAVRRFAAAERPEYVFVAAARVGGILANSTHPVEFLRDNLQIELNVIDAAFEAGASKLEFLGSSCIYPKFADQPIREDSLLTGALEPTNEWYAVAKIAGIKLCQAYFKQHGFRAISLMPTNLYGPEDNFDLLSSHVLPAMLRKFHEAKRDGAAKVEIWGSGTPRREFLHVDDLADAAVFFMRTYESPEIVNIGTGVDLPIRDLAEMIAGVTGFTGEIAQDLSKPDGTPRKLLDVSRAREAGWKAKITLAEGIRQTYEWFVKRQTAVASVA